MEGGQPRPPAFRRTDTVWSLDPNVPLAQVQTMEAVVERSMERTTFTMFCW